MKYSVVFLGTSEFAVPFLEELIEHPNYSIQAVFTQPDKIGGRKKILIKSPIKQIAEREDIPLYQPENINDTNFQRILLNLNPDFLITVSFGQILHEIILKVPKIAALNAHASLLPKYRGASPIQSALLNGEKITGVAIQIMSKKMDAGDILGTQTHEIKSTDTYKTLTSTLSIMGSMLLIDVLDKPLNPLPQKQDHVTYCKKLTREDGKIEWESMTADEIDRRIRAFDPWPQTYTSFQNKRLKIISGKPSKNSTNKVPPGTILRTDGAHIGVQCKEGIFELENIQLEGKKAMYIEHFAKGYQDLIGSKFV